MINKSASEIELELLLEGIFRLYGYDFRRYARSSLKRRLALIMTKFDLKSYSQLQDKLLHDEASLNEFLLEMSITVTEMFRDPSFYQAFRQNVVPLLKTYPFFKIWHAGCATGEEVYSMAILLHEEGLLDRATIYATDFNNEAIAHAKSGIYKIDTVQKYIKNYTDSGGKDDFSKYYHAKYGAVKMHEFLKTHITYANHNLASDKVFGEMNVILCRNVLIYFNSELQDRVLKLFSDSLCSLGFLCLGSRETINFSSIANNFIKIEETQKIYRKK